MPIENNQNNQNSQNQESFFQLIWFYPDVVVWLLKKIRKLLVRILLGALKRGGITWDCFFCIYTGMVSLRWSLL